MVDSQLKEDTGDFFRDTNAARYPSYPMEPAFRAIHALQPTYDMQSVDVVGCGSTLGNLMRFARSEHRVFRFDVDVLHDTVIFIRKEKSPTELLQDVRGFGHTFPEAYTSWDSEVRNSRSHQRVIGYEFGGLKMLVRTETDGYVRQDPPKLSSAIARNVQSFEGTTDSLDNLAVSNDSPSIHGPLVCKMRGDRISQKQIFDIKTRGIAREFDMDEALPRLWLNQTPKFLIAYHRRGLFNRPQVRDVKAEIDEWEKSNAAVLACFHAVLARIVNVVRESDQQQQQYEVSWDGKGPLLVTLQTEPRRALSPETMGHFGESE